MTSTTCSKNLLSSKIVRREYDLEQERRLNSIDQEDHEANSKVIKKLFEFENALKNKHLYQKQSVFSGIINNYRNKGYAIKNIDEANYIFENHPLLMEDYEFEMEIELNANKPIFKKVDKYLERMNEQSFKSVALRRAESMSAWLNRSQGRR